MEASNSIPEDIDEKIIKEVYAYFGKAYYWGECLHKNLANYHAIVDFRSFAHITRPRFEENLKLAFSLTLGQLFSQLKNNFPMELQETLSLAVEKRNFIAHYFWFERVHLMYSHEGITQMINELENMSELFTDIDKRLTIFTKPKYEQLGMTDEIIQSLFEDMKSKPPPPLPNYRKIKKQERIINVWEFVLLNGNKELIFETDDGCYLQLCDVGLGWTHLKKTIYWQINNDIQQYLPANIVSRPKDVQPWEYHFTLSKGVIFWVKPGKRPGLINFELTFQAKIKE
jgi:hypothetical protein